jgi:TPR repeat protein
MIWRPSLPRTGVNSMQRIAIALGMALLSPAAFAQVNTARLIADCDRLAASDLDSDRPAAVPGVAFQAVDGKAAVAACLAAAKAAPAEARIVYQLGRALEADKKIENAMKAYELADSFGYAIGSYGLAVIFERNRDFPQSRWFHEKAAAAGSPMAMRALAFGYDNGANGIEKDPAQAQRWYEQSRPGFERLAAQGSPVAMFQTGWMYQLAKGTPQDLAKAIFWYEKAAAAGFAQAMNNLGGLYEDGTGVPRNLDLAERWYERAAKAGLALGASNLEKLRVAQGKAATPPVPTSPARAPDDHVATGAVTPERVAAEMELAAKRQQDSGKSFSLQTWLNFRTSASDPGFAAALGNHAVMLITVLAQRPEELPLRQVYIRAGGRDIAVTKLSSWRSQADNTPAASRLFGRHREDGLYLIPISMMLRDGQILFDLSANRAALPLLQLPSKALQGRSDPGAPVATDAKGVKTFIARNFPGFPVGAGADDPRGIHHHPLRRTRTWRRSLPADSLILKETQHDTVYNPRCGNSCCRTCVRTGHHRPLDRRMRPARCQRPGRVAVPRRAWPAVLCHQSKEGRAGLPRCREGGAE